MTITAPQIKAIHYLKKAAGLTDADYRGLLKDRYRVVSSKDLSESAAGGLIKQLKELSGQTSGRRAKDTVSGKYASVLRALWIAAHNLAIVRDVDDRALIAFVQRQTGVTHTRFLSEKIEGDKAIEALKAWIAREAGLVWPTPAQARDLNISVVTARKRTVLHAIAARIIQFGPPLFSLQRYLKLSCLPPLVQMTDAQLDKLAAQLGAQLRGYVATAQQKGPPKRACNEVVAS